MGIKNKMRKSQVPRGATKKERCKKCERLFFAKLKLKKWKEKNQGEIKK